MAENPLRRFARLLGGVILTEGHLGHQVLGQLLIADATEVEVAGANLAVAATSRQRNAFAQAAIRTAVPALAVHSLLRTREKRLEARERRLAERAQRIAEATCSDAEAKLAELAAENRRLRAELADLQGRPPEVPAPLDDARPGDAPPEVPAPLDDARPGDVDMPLPTVPPQTDEGGRS